MCPTDSPLSELFCESPDKGSDSADDDAATSTSSSPSSTSSGEPAAWHSDKRALYLAAAKPKMYAVALIPVAVGAAAAFASGGGGGSAGAAAAAAAASATAAAATSSKSAQAAAAAAAYLATLVPAPALLSALASASLAFLAKALSGSCLIIAWLNLSNDAFDHSTGVDEAGDGKPESVVSLVAGGKAWPVHAVATLCLVSGALLLASALGYDVSPAALTPRWLSEAAAAAWGRVSSVAGSVSATAASAVSGAAEAVASVASSSSSDSAAAATAAASSSSSSAASGAAAAATAAEGGGGVVGGVLAPVASLFHGGASASASAATAATTTTTASTTALVPWPASLSPPPPDPRPARLLAAAVAAGYLYQGPPFRLSRKGLGEPLAFVAFGPLATVAFALAAGNAAFLAGLRARVAAIAAAQASPSSMSNKAAAAATAAATAAWPLPLATPAAASAAVVVGMTTAAVLFCSHFHQIEGDRAAGKMSPLVRLGAADGARVLASGVAGVYAFVGAAVALGALPPLAAAAAALFSLPRGIALAARAAREGGDAARIRTLKLDALGWHGAFGMALALGLAVPRAAAAVASFVLGV